MGVSSTEASLRAVRQDLDLPAAGSIKERAVLNKVNKTLPVSLSGFKGNVLGTQLYIPGGTQPLSESSWPKRKDEAFGTYYIYRDGSVMASSDRIRIEHPDRPSYNGDSGTEVRICGTVSEDGRYLLTGNATGRFAISQGNAIHAQLHVQLISNAGDYLSGGNQLLVNDVFYRRDGTTFSWNRYVNLSTGRPYITLIFRYIMSGIGTTSNRYSHEFSNFELVKA
jgi:hypothetical protein